MPVDDRDDAPKERPPAPEQSPQSEIKAALESETDAPLPPAAERVAERDADRPEPATPQGQRRRFVTRRNALILTISLAVGVAALILLALLAYRFGYVDRYIARQIKDTFAQYGIRAEIKEFHTSGARDVVMNNVELYDSATGEKLGTIDKLTAKIRIEDLYALRLRRNINLQELTIDGLEVWVRFDAEGNSNFRNLRLPPPDPNRRILFSYSTAKIEIKRGVVHYGDERHEISGEARNIAATIEPDNPNAPAESWMNTVNFSATDSTFVYDGRPVNNIDVTARGRVNQTRAEIQELVLRSPLAEARMTGVMDDWRALRYRFNITSTVDLTQTSDILQAGTSLRGVGNFVGTVEGEGSRYTVDGEIKSDALAADGVRVQSLQATAKGTGTGSSYEVEGRAVAELLTAGDFQLNALQVAGGVMGTGKDFRWVGELRAAAARYQNTSISGLIVSDAVAEMREGVVTANAKRALATSMSAQGASINGAQATDLRVRSENGVTTASAATVQAGNVTAQGARVSGLTASGVDVVDRNGATSVVVNQVRVGGVNAAGATIGSLNIAGVRLSIRGGRVEGTSGDINAGNVQIARSGDFEGGTVRDVRLARPVFVLEPSGRYRASADLSLGGGVLASVQLGAARAALTATNNQVQLQNFNAEILNGRASGDAVLSTARGGASRVTASFSDLDVNQIIALTAKRNVPISGRATGTADLAFRGTDIKNTATGNVRAEFSGETGTEATGTTPLTGTVALNATSGLFQIERANLRTQASEINASGQFSFAREESNLQLDLASSDATELQSVITSTGLLPTFEEQLDRYNIALGGRLTFNGTVRGKLDDPSVQGRASLDSLLVNGRDMGSLTAALNLSPSEINVTEGRLVERDGGGIQFSLNAPRGAGNNIALDATLDRANAGNLLAAFPTTGATPSTDAPARFGNIQADVSGRVRVTGLPDNMAGDANLRFGPGAVGGERFESIVAQATFAGSKVNLNRVEARFDAGTIVAEGNYDTGTRAFDIAANGAGIQLNRLTALAGNTGGLPQVTGTADITARATGIFTDFSTYQITIDGTGRNVKINDREAGQLTLSGRTEGKLFNLTLTTGILGQPQVITARVDLSKELLPTTVETTFAGVDLSSLFATLLPPGTAVQVTGRATGRLSAEGNLITRTDDGEEFFSLGGLRGSANFTGLSIQVEDVQLSATSPLLIQFSSNEVFFEKTQFTGTGTNVLFGGTLAIGPGGRQNLSIDGQLNLRVLNSLSPDLFLSGTAGVAVRVGGTFEQPRLNGSASVAGASVSALITDQRLTVSNIDGRVIFNSNFAQINQLTGTLGGGRVQITGGALLSGYLPSRFRLNVRGDDVTVPFPEGFRTTADADLDINGTRSANSGIITTIISGPVNLRRAEYTEDIELADLINQRRDASLTEGGESQLAANTQLDLRVEGRDALVVRNNLADVVGSVSLRIVGPMEDPVVSGRITATRGTLNFRRERYEVTRGFIDLPARRDADPLLNIQAEADIRGYRVVANLTGPLSQPSATVRSDPALPQVDVVSLIVTGELSQDGSGGSVLAQSGVGTAASLLANTIINDPLRKATNKLYGLSLEIDPLIAGRGGASPTARLRVTQPISRNISVTYSTNLTADQNQVLAVEYRVSDRLSFIAQYEQGSASGFSSRNDNFSFEIRFRKRF